MLPTELTQRGILWSTDDDEIASCIRRVSDEKANPDLIAAVNLLLQNREVSRTPGSQLSILYQKAMEEASTRIQASSEFLLMKSNPTPENIRAYSNHFANIYPRSVVSRYEVPATEEVVELESPPLTDSMRDEIMRLERQFFQAASRVHVGPQYVGHIEELMGKYFKKYPMYAALRIITISELAENVANLGFEPPPESFSRIVWRGIRDYLGSQAEKKKGYKEWRTVVTRLSFLVDPKLSALIHWLWADDAEQMVEVPEDYKSLMNLTGAIMASLQYSGVSDDVALEMMRPIMFRILPLVVKHQEPLDLGFRKWLWSLYIEGASQRFTIPERVSGWLRSIKQWAHSDSAPASFINSVSSVVTAICLGLYNVLDRLFELILGVVETALPHYYEGAIEYFYLSRAFASGLLPESRRRPKAVWALLMTSSFTRLTPAERFALSCRHMDDITVDPVYSEWAQERINKLKEVTPGFDIEVPIPVRPVRYPKEPTVADEELAALAPYITGDSLRTNALASAWVKRLRDQGILPGMDSLWFATPDRVSRSIMRYDIDRPTPDVATKTLTLKAADALVDQYPEMYQDGVYLTPEACLRKIKVKFSPGLPFIPVFKTRKDLASHGLLDGMVKVARRYLEDGVHPGTMAHAFAKSDVRKLENLLNLDKNLRTVIAQDLVGSLLAFPATLEPTRRQPPIDAFVMNATPRSEGGFRPFYDVLKESPVVFQGDGEQFDSKIAPVVTVDGLCRIRSRAFEKQHIHDVAKSQIVGSYRALLRCTMVGLDTGYSYRHTGGFMTGQANTSPDNRDAFRIIMVSAWSAVTEREPERFFSEGNRIGNAGDDAVLALKEEWVIKPMLKWIKENHGVTFVPEATGFWNVDLVGLQPIPVPEDSKHWYRVEGVPVPDYSIASKPAAMLLKRTEWKVNTARFYDVAFLMRHIEGLIGTAYLTAHHAQIYESLAEEYETETSYILLRYYKKVSIRKVIATTGYLESIFFELGEERDRYKGKTANIRKWLASHRFPTYPAIFSIWIRPQAVEQTKMRKDHTKILSWNPQLSGTDRFLWGLMHAREVLNTWIPHHVARSIPEFTGLDVTYIMKNPDYTIAKFAWLCLYRKTSKIPTASLMSIVLKENPYGSAEDLVGFLTWLGEDENLKALMNEDLELLRGRMLVITFFYWQIERIFKLSAQIPVLGILFNLYALTTRDINRLYAALNYVYMIAEGRSSAVISNMMPPDPYAWIKQMSVILGNAIPSRWQYIPGSRQAVSVLPWMVELWAAGDATLLPRPYRLLNKLIPIPTLWANLVKNLELPILDPDRLDPFLVIAPTGTGKSTAFVATIMLGLGFTKTIWILCPTIVARDNYQNDFLPPKSFQVLSKGVVNVATMRVKVLTYGHFNIRGRTEIQKGDLILFDEMHLRESYMLVCWHLFQQSKRGIITATPAAKVMPLPTLTLRYPGSRRFAVSVTRSSLNFTDLWTKLSSSNPELLVRALIVVPTVKKMEMVVQTLARLSIVGHRLFSGQSTPSPSGVIVATTIVDTAVTIEPPPTCLIDFGETLKIDISFDGVLPVHTVSIVPTPPSVHTQRLGRVGRAGDSKAFVLGQAGLGPEPEVEPSAFGLLYEQSVSGAVLLSFGLTSIVQETNKMPGLLRFITTNNGEFVGGEGGNDFGLALYIFQRLSDRASVEATRDEWLGLRLVDSEHEILNIIIDDIVANGFGDPRRGNWARSLALLQSGFFGVHVGGKFVATSCLGVSRGTVVPCGFPWNETTGLYDHQQIPIRLSGFSSVHWTIRKNFEVIQPGYDVYRSERAGVAPTLLRETLAESIQPVEQVVTSFHVALRTLYDSFTMRMYPRVDSPARYVQLILVGEQQHFVTAKDMTVDLGVGFDFTIDRFYLNNNYVPVNISRLGFFITLAAACNERDIVLQGEVPDAVGSMPVTSQIYGCLTDLEVTFVVINPNWARSVVGRYWDYLRENQGDKYLSSLDIVIYTDGVERPPSSNRTIVHRVNGKAFYQNV